jgi:hypothetical protein
MPLVGCTAHHPLADPTCVLWHCQQHCSSAGIRCIHSLTMGGSVVDVAGALAGRVHPCSLFGDHTFVLYVLCNLGIILMMPLQPLVAIRAMAVC